MAITSSPAALPIKSLSDRYEYAGSAGDNDPGAGAIVTVDRLT